LLAGQEGSLLDLKKTLIFLMTIAFLFVSNNLQLDKKTKMFIEITIVISSIFIMTLYFVKHNEIYNYTNLGVKYLYFNFSNPNFTSMYMLVYGMYNLILSWNFKKRMLKILCFGLAIFMFFSVLETLSRNTILIGILFWVMFCYIRFKKTVSLRYSRAVSMFVSVWPLFFSFIYIFLINYSDQMKFLSFLDMNKGFDTRIKVWENVFEKLSQSPIIGDFSFAVLRQAHNSHLDIWVSYGILALFLTCLFIFLIVYNSGQEYTNRISYLYMLGFICCCFIGMAEAALFAGCQGLFIMVGIYILLSKSENTV
jgi:O-antigen ligase